MLATAVRVRRVLAPAISSRPATAGGDGDDDGRMRDGTRWDGERWLVWSPSGLEITLHTINGLVRQLLLVRERRVPVKVVCLRDGEV